MKDIAILLLLAALTIVLKAAGYEGLSQSILCIEWFWLGIMSKK
jgi:hypothetical protein